MDANDLLLSSSLLMDTLNGSNRRRAAHSCAGMQAYAELYEQDYVLESAVRLIIVGAGNRGRVYAAYALEHPSRAQVVAVADPIRFRRESMAKEHNLSPENVYEDWNSLAEREKFADAVVICTPDSLHVGPAIAFMNKGYHILVEKPMAVTEADCLKMTETALRNKVIMAVGHVLRYTPYTQKIKELVQSGALGEVINVQHLEPVGYWHAAHSYVRGNWRREDESTFMLMAKSCHDIDWLRYIVGKKFKRVSSFGSRRHFRKESKPAEAGAVTRCLDCALQDTCPYSAKTVYLKPAERGHTRWPLTAVVTDTEINVASVEEALKTGPYGRCVYESDNDVVDNQVVNMEFEGGCTGTFSMIAFTTDICVRKTRIFGSHGQLECEMSSPGKIVYDNFRGEGTSTIVVPEHSPPSHLSGHSGADYYLMRAFVQAVAKNDPSYIVSGPLETLESHLVVFKAENARKSDAIVDIDVTKDLRAFS